MPNYNPEDITKGSGPLKGVRGADLYSDNFERDDLLESIQRLGQISQNNLWRSQTGRSGSQYVGMPGFMEAYNLPEGAPGSEYGNSRFDRGVMVAPTEEDIANKRANTQTGVGKFLNGVSKGAVLAGTTFLDGTLGLAFGIVDAAQSAAQGDKEWYAKLWDNSVSNGLQQINQLSEEAMPNYRTTEEMNRNWVQNLGTVNFWADTFLKNLGFTVGAFYSGGVATKLLKGAKLLKSGLGAAVLGSVYSAINEGRIEANNNTDDWKKLQIQQIDDAYTRQAQLLYQSGLPEEALKAELMNLDSQRQKALGDVEDNASAVGLIDLMSNIAILSATNLFTYGRVYSKGFETAKMQAAKAGRQISQEAAKEAAEKALVESEGKSFANMVKKVGGKYEWNDITKAKVLFNGARTALREGNEEMAQALAAEFAGQVYTPDSPETYYRIGLDDTAKRTTDDLFDTLITSFANTYGNGDRWEEFAVGALTGLLGMPTFGAANNSSADTYLGRGKKIGLTGGLAGEFKSAKEMNAQGKAGVEKMNAFLEKFEEGKNPFYRRTSLSNAMDGWVAKDNKFEYKNAEDNDLFETIKQFSKMGKMADLEELIGDAFYNVSDEQLQSIATAFSPEGETVKEGEESNYRDKNGQLLSDTEEGRKIMRDMLKNKGDSILQDIRDYDKSLQYVRNISGNSEDTERVTELAWMHWKLGKFSSRYASLVSDNAAELKDFVENAKTRIGILDEDIKKTQESLAAAADDKKEEIKGKLDALNEEKDILSKASDFSERILTNKDIQKFLVSLPENLGQYLTEASQAYISLLQDGNISASTGFMASLGALADVPAIIGAWNSFNETLQEFIKNPTAMDKMHQKVDEEKAVVNKEKAKQEIIDKNKGKSAKDLADLSDAAFAELDNLDSLPEELSEQKRLADEIRSDGVAALSAIDSSEFSQDDKDALRAVMNARTPSERAALLSGEDEMNPEDIANFKVEDSELEQLRKQIEEKKGEAPTDEELAQAAAQLQEAKARKFVDDIRAAVAEGKEVAKTMPKEKKEEKRLPAPKLTAEQQAEQDKFARMLATPLVEAAIIPEIQKSQISRTNDLLDRIRYWREHNPEHLWALIHNDSMYQEITAASAMPGMDEAVIVDFLKNKVIFPNAKAAPAPAAAPHSPAAPEQSPSPSPAPSNLQGSQAETPSEDKAEVEEEQEVAGKEPEKDINTFSVEAAVVDGALVFDEHGNIIRDAAISGMTDAQNRELQARRKYLDSVGAFANRYNGLVYPGKEAHFEIREDANNAIGGVMILIVDSNGNVLGDMKPVWNTRSKERREWTVAKEKEYREWVEAKRAAGQDVGTYVLKETTKIKDNTPGRFPFIPNGKDGKMALSLKEIMWALGSDGMNHYLPIMLGVVRDKVQGELLFSYNTSKNVADPANKEQYEKGDIFLVIPTGKWTLDADGELQQEYRPVPLSNVESVYDGSQKNAITRAFNAWKEYATKEIEASKDNKLSSGTYGELGHLLANVFGAYFNFSVKSEKVDNLWHIVIDKPTAKYYAANNFAGNQRRTNNEEAREGLKERLVAFGLGQEETNAILQRVLNAKNAEEARAALAAVPMPEGTRLVYNHADKSVSIVTRIFSERLGDPNFVKALADTFTGERISADASKINTTVKFLGKEIQYNNLLADSLKINFARGIGRTVNSFFSLEEFDMSHRAEAPKETVQPAAQPAAAATETAQETSQVSDVVNAMSREQLVDEIKTKLGSNADTLFSAFDAYLNTDTLKRILNDSGNLDILRDMLSQFDEDTDDASEVWKDVESRMSKPKDISKEPVSAKSAEPEVKAVKVTIKGTNGNTQEYTVSGTVIRNTKGEIVYSKASKQRKLILLEADVASGRAVKIDGSYVSNNGFMYDTTGGEMLRRNIDTLRKAYTEGKFADGVDKTGIIEAAYSWLALSGNEQKGFIDKYFSGRKVDTELLKEAQDRWKNLSIEEKLSELNCY